ncbi:hypothetical protein [Nonomuraea recticatena]
MTANNTPTSFPVELFDGPKADRWAPLRSLVETAAPQRKERR